MKFEDMKKIWDEQNQQHLYVIDEQQLHATITAKKRGASKFVNVMEIVLILVNLITGSVILAMHYIKGAGNIFAISMGLLMVVTSVYIYTLRIKRLKNEDRFDRTLLGDLEHAIKNASYQAQLSFFLLMYFIPIGLLTIANAIHENKSPEKIFLVAAFVVITWFLGRWEHRSWHVARKKRLEAMKEKLMESV